MNRNAHAQLPQHTVEVGDAAHAMKFAKSGLPGDTWVPTVVNPAEKGNGVEKVLFWTHLLVWVVALVMTSITNFGAPGFMSNSSNASRDSDGVLTGEITYSAYQGITTTTQVIGILGGVASIIGVLLLLGSAAWFKADEFAGTGIGLILNVFIQFFTLFGTTSTFYIFAQAASITTDVYYGLSLTATIFMVYAQVLLYCTSSAIGVAALPRAFIPSLAASVQFISAMAINSGDFAPHATTMQKTVAWVVPILTIVALLMMFGLRIATQPGGLLSKYPATSGTGKLTVSNIKNRPFLRSLFLTPYLVSGILSVYKLSFVKLDPDPTSYVFAFFGMMLNFAIIGVVFNPSAELAGIDDDVA
tara:strand:+ start:1384 stop:2460 length:1077 start_codon:yes stop_codon:yes gene_type:complete